MLYKNKCFIKFAQRTNMDNNINTAMTDIQKSAGLFDIFCPLSKINCWWYLFLLHRVWLYYLQWSVKLVLCGYCVLVTWQ